MEQYIPDFILLLRNALLHEKTPADIPLDQCLLLQAQKHGVANLLYYGIQGMNVAPATVKLLKEFAYAAAVREAIQQKELEAIFDEFESKRISVLPLKGCVIKQLYPKPEMRYMSDMDLLIRPEDAGKVREILESLDYEVFRFDNGATDIYRSPDGMNYELHRDLSEEGYNAASKSFLEELLSMAWLSEGKSCILELPPEEHYAYILCHFVKHLLDGGIGVRQVMDIHICRKNWSFDEEKLTELLEKLELIEFTATLELLAESWFGNAEGNEVTEELGQYILGSGVFGKEEQRVADRMLKEERKKSKASYIFSRLFPSYKIMSFYYPVLKKIPVLLPVFWAWRMIYALLFRRRKLGKEISTVSETDRSALQERAAFYQRCGLKVYTEIRKGRSK